MVGFTSQAPSLAGLCVPWVNLDAQLLGSEIRVFDTRASTGTSVAQQRTSAPHLMAFRSWQGRGQGTCAGSQELTAHSRPSGTLGALGSLTCSSAFQNLLLGQHSPTTAWSLLLASLCHPYLLCRGRQTGGQTASWNELSALGDLALGLMDSEKSSSRAPLGSKAGIQ